MRSHSIVTAPVQTVVEVRANTYSIGTHEGQWRVSRRRAARGIIETGHEDDDAREAAGEKDQGVGRTE
jgi:hypothetical protein